MANRTASNFKSTQDSVFADNTTREISEADSRNAYTDISESVQFYKNSVENLGSDPTTWNVNSYDIVNATSDFSASGTLTLSNSVDLGTYLLSVNKSTASNIEITIAHSGITVVNPGNEAALTLSGDSGDDYLIIIRRVGAIMYVGTLSLESQTVPDADTTTKGIIEIATQSEVDAGTDTTKAVVPSTLSSYAVPDADTTTKGKIEIATQTEVNTGTDTNRAVTPSTLANRTATETRAGSIEIATQTETNNGTDDNRAVTPVKLANYISNAGISANLWGGTADRSPTGASPSQSLTIGGSGATSKIFSISVIRFTDAATTSYNLTISVNTQIRGVHWMYVDKDIAGDITFTMQTSGNPTDIYTAEDRDGNTSQSWVLSGATNSRYIFMILVGAHNEPGSGYHVQLLEHPSEYFLDEDDMSSDSDTKAPTQQSVKAYVDNREDWVAIAVSDETSDISTGTAKATFRMPYAATLTDVRASVTTAPTGSGITVDINESGTSVLSTKLTIDATEKTSTTAATAAVISDSSIADDAEITIDIDAVGSTVAGAGLKVILYYTRT